MMSEYLNLQDSLELQLRAFKIITSYYFFFLHKVRLKNICLQHMVVYTVYWSMYQYISVYQYLTIYFFLFDIYSLYMAKLYKGA